jgi:hypothetical protein
MSGDGVERPESEFDAIMMYTSSERPVMSVPPQCQATKRFTREVMDATGITDESEAARVADWIVNKMERYGASTSRPVFTMDGEGPKCSWCGMIWPLCGHHHLSEVLDDDEESDTNEPTS